MTTEDITCIAENEAKGDIPCDGGTITVPEALAHSESPECVQNRKQTFLETERAIETLPGSVHPFIVPSISWHHSPMLLQSDTTGESVADCVSSLGDVKRKT